MGVAIPQVASEDPAYISYLLSPDLDHDCYFMVKRTVYGQPERIGAVKKMLLAHSLVLRTQFQERKIADKGDILVDDVDSHTFKNLLRYVYGHDHTSVLSFSEADDLLYVAEKYLMTQLKDKLSLRLLRLLTPDNICKLLNNPACFMALDLNSHITKILQFETDQVINSYYFRDLTSSAMVKILEQNVLNVSEIELWWAALKWARHKADSRDGKVLRETLSTPLKHIRFCTLSHEDFFEEVVPRNVLTDTEVKLVSLSKHKKESEPDLTEVSNNVEPRAKIGKTHFGFTSSLYEHRKSFEFIVLTGNEHVELSLNGRLNHQYPRLLTHPAYVDLYFDVTIFQTKSKDRECIFNVLNIERRVKSNEEFCIPISKAGEKVKLDPKSKYEIKVVYFILTNDLQVHKLPSSYQHIMLPLGSIP